MRAAAEMLGVTPAEVESDGLVLHAAVPASGREDTCCRSAAVYRARSTAPRISWRIFARSSASGTCRRPPTGFSRTKRSSVSRLAIAPVHAGESGIRLRPDAATRRRDAGRDARRYVRGRADGAERSAGLDVDDSAGSADRARPQIARRDRRSDAEQCRAASATAPASSCSITSSAATWSSLRSTNERAVVDSNAIVEVEAAERGRDAGH